MASVNIEDARRVSQDRRVALLVDQPERPSRRHLSWSFAGAGGDGLSDHQSNAEVVLPDQAKAVKQYKGRLRKMTAAQKDIHGGFRLNVDAQVAEHQLIKVLQESI